jgi:minor extracellular serine protease Vpr
MEGLEDLMRRILSFSCVIALVAALGGPAAAQDGLLPRATPERVDRVTVDLGNTPAPGLDEIVKVFIQLDEPSVAEFNAGNSKSSAAQQAQARRVERQQDRLRGQLASRGAQEIYSMKIGANGIAVAATVRDLAEIGQLNGVKSIAALPTHTVNNETSVPWIGTPQVWESLGYTGENIHIAIIDTGIDYLHASFGGSGDPADFAANDPTTLTDGGFTAKVAGGYDFVGDDYDASTPGLDVPQPDPDPLDCNGHGTHVAGTAAGFGVAADGTTYSGAYDTSLDLADFMVGPGVAPHAILYALKVFGCDGSTQVTAEAIEWALDPDGDGSTDDALDVINMSLGSDFGSPGDPTAIASSNAAAMGVIVVVAAGNDGQVPYVHGSPAASPDVISVAASADGGISADGLLVNLPEELEGTVLEAAEGAITAPLWDVGPVTGDLEVAEPLLACQPLDNDFAGRIAFIQRGVCPFTDKVLNAQEAGASAVVVFNNVAGDPIVMGGSSAGITIPGMMISLADGSDLLSRLGSGQTVNVTLSDAYEFPKPELADTLATFTSSGPRGGDAFGPDLTAPGVNIGSAAVGSGNAGNLSSGTSMATPHMAGLAALIREARPDAAPAVVKSLMMNSTGEGAAAFRTTLAGTGLARADAALALDAYTMPAGVGFGRLNPLETTTETRTVTVNDLSGDTRTYGIGHGPIQSHPGVTVATSSTEVTVPANGSAEFEISVTIDPGAMVPDDGFYSQREVDGIVTLTSDAASLRVGYMAVVDPASAVSSFTVKPGQQTSLGWSNESASDGFFDTFTLVGTGTGSLAALGVRTDLAFGPNTVEFGVAHTEAWDSRSVHELDIFLDTDQDGTFDFVLVQADLGYLQGLAADGRSATALFDLTTGGGSLQWLVIADLNDQVQILAVDRHGPFGFLDEGNTTFDYLAIDFDLRMDAPVGFATGSVDLDKDADKVVNLSGLLPAGMSGTAELRNASRQAILALYQNNQESAQYEIVQLKPGQGNNPGQGGGPGGQP